MFESRCAGYAPAMAAAVTGDKMEALTSVGLRPRLPKISASKAAPSILLMGVGERHRHDMLVGLYVARRIRQECGNAVAVVEKPENVLDLIEDWQQGDVVFVVDAVVDGEDPGTIHRFEVSSGTGCDQEIPGNILFSKQTAGLAEIVKLAQHLGKLPPQLVIYAIEAEHFERGDGLSLQVFAAAEQVTRELLASIRTLGRPGTEVRAAL